MEINRRLFFASLGGPAAVALMSSEQKANALEAYMEEMLNQAVAGQQGGAPAKYPPRPQRASRRAPMWRPREF